MPIKKAHVVLVFAGHDPCGGAGLCADIQAISSLGAHPAPIVTAITAQNTQTVHLCEPVDSRLVYEQINSLLVDMPIHAIKIGLIGSIENGCVIRDLIKMRPEIPVILDPVINAGAGQNLTDPALLHFIVQELLPRTTVLTPNSLEADRLAPYSQSRAQCAEKLLSLGIKHLLITGGHDDSAQIINHYYSSLGEYTRFRWPRLEGEFHGSGCTLASSIAALMAQGACAMQAISDAQSYTWSSLKHARAIGRGQLIPNRLHYEKISTIS
jgi:hydroxymethylpyrimidine/phosphomethylpyrimidine kinase